MNSLPLWRGTAECLPEISWETAFQPPTALRLTEMLQVLNDAFDRLPNPLEAPLASEAA